MPWSGVNWQASFRGVAFRVDDAELEGGRRYAEHRAAQRVIPRMEDMGRSERRYSVTAYLTGDDSLEQRDRLIEVCENRGAPGDLVHPFYGVVLVLCEGFRVRESEQEGRIVRLTMRFREADERRLVQRRTSGPGEADAAAATFGDTAEDSVAAGLQVKGQPQGVLDMASQTMSKAGKALLALDVLAGPELEVAALASLARSLINQAEELVTSPVDFARTLSGALESVLSAAGDAARGALEAYRELAGMEGPQAPGGPGEASAAAAANLELTLGLVHGVSIAGMVRAAARVRWGWYEEAIEARDEIADLLDALADSGQGGDESYQAATELRRALYASVPPPDENLPRLGSIHLAAATPAVVLAARLYDDPARGDEIAIRNHLSHPGFLPSGVELEVLTSA